MKCLRCGYCCMNYMVIIVDDPIYGTDPSNLKPHMGEGPCQHLIGNTPGEYKCAIHHYPWFIDTPCFAFTQIEDSIDDPCRIGDYNLNGNKWRNYESKELGTS